MLSITIFASPHSLEILVLSLLHGGGVGWGGVGSKRCCQIFKFLFTDIKIGYLHNKRLVCLLSVKKLAPDHTKPTHQGIGL